MTMTQVDTYTRWITHPSEVGISSSGTNDEIPLGLRPDD